MTPSAPRTPPPRSDRADAARPATERPASRTAPLPAAPALSACPECWGQRRIIESRPAANGEGSVRIVTACPRCLGIGEVLR